MSAESTATVPRGTIASRASDSDPRFSSYAYVPENADGTIAVLVHGSDRSAKELCDGFRDWAANCGCSLLAPLFPSGIGKPGDMDDYKSVLSNGIRYDLVLMNMISEFRHRYGFVHGSIVLFGFSGGAQFAHRFALLHPSEIRALSIGAPGNVTMLDDSRPWWVGTGGLRDLVGQSTDLDTLATVPVQTLIGSADDGREVIHVERHESRWVEGANDAGVTRGERLERLANNWRSHGVQVQSVIVPDSAHTFEPMIPYVCSFFEDQLQSSPAPPSTGDLP